MLFWQAQAPPHGDQAHGGSLTSPGKRQKPELLEVDPLTSFFFGEPNSADSR
jgi:hypothetical protein